MKKNSITNQGYANWLSSYPLTKATTKGQEINIGEEARKGEHTNTAYRNVS